MLRRPVNAQTRPLRRDGDACPHAPLPSQAALLGIDLLYHPVVFSSTWIPHRLCAVPGEGRCC